MKKKSLWLDNRSPWLLPYIALVTSDKEYQNVLDERNIRSGAVWLCGTAQASTHMFYGKEAEGGTLAIVCISPDAKIELPTLAGLLAHEATHVFEYFMKHIGEAKPSHEFRAYSVQFIVYRLIEAYIARVMKPKRAPVGIKKRK